MVLLSDLSGGQRELLGKGQDRPQSIHEIGFPPVGGEGPNEGVVLSDRTERRPVMLDSVMAPVDGGDHHTDGLPLRPGEGAPSEHERSVEGVVVPESLGVQRRAPEDVGDGTGAPAYAAVDIRELAFGFRWRDGLDPRGGTVVPGGMIVPVCVWVVIGQWNSSGPGSFCWWVGKLLRCAGGVVYAASRWRQGRIAVVVPAPPRMPKGLPAMVDGAAPPAVADGLQSRSAASAVTSMVTS